MSERKHSTTQLLAAFAAVYFIWGSTYLFIRYAIQTLPPFLMASGRFLFGGVLLYGWSRWKGAPAGSSLGWRRAFILGALLFLFGNAYAQKTVAIVDTVDQEFFSFDKIDQLKDPNNNFTFEQISSAAFDSQFTSSGQATPMIHELNTTYWFRIKIKH